MEPSGVPQNVSLPLDSIPNILLRSKLAPEVVEPMKRFDAQEVDASRLKLYSKSIQALLDKLASIQEDLQRSAAEQTSLLLAYEIVSSGTATPKSKSMVEEDMDAILENSIRLMYTGNQ